MTYITITYIIFLELLTLFFLDLVRLFVAIFPTEIIFYTKQGQRSF